MSFAYNASAIALGGNIILPSPVIIPSQASVALAPTGGEGRQTVKNFDYNGIITFDEASVYVTGSKDSNDVYNTLATVSIRNLNVLNVLHADFLVASITSSHKKGAEEGNITFQGTSVDNLRIAGRRVEPRFNHSLFARYPTHKGIKALMKDSVATCGCPEVKTWVEDEVEKAKADPKFDEKKVRAELGGRNVAGLVAGRYCWKSGTTVDGAPDDHGHIHCSLADSIPEIDEMSEDDEAKIGADDLPKFHPVRRNGYIVKVEGFGKIKLAEIVIKPGERRFNMFRLELGSPTSGDMTVGSAGTNGTELIP